MLSRTVMMTWPTDDGEKNTAEVELDNEGIAELVRFIDSHDGEIY